MSDKILDQIQKIRAKAKEVEFALCGHLVANRANEVMTVATIVDDKDFQYDESRKIFQLAKQSILENRDFTALVLNDDKIKIGDFLEYAIEPRNIQQLAREVKSLATSWRFYALLTSTVSKFDPEKTSETISALEIALIKISEFSNREKVSAVEVIGELEKEQAEISARIKAGQKYIGDECGFEFLDKAVEGLRKGMLWVLGGYTSTGKTFFALNIINSLLEQNKRVVFYSLEMSKIQIMTRLLTIRTELGSNAILKDAMNDEQRAIFTVEKDFLKESELNVYTEISEIDQLRFSMVEENMRKPVDCFVLDYIQLATSANPRDDEYVIMKKAADGLRALAQKIGVPIIVLSQISNEGAKTKSAALMSYKGAGNIASAADFGLELVSDETAEEIAKKQLNGVPISVVCWIKKNRHGKKGVGKYLFDSWVGKFVENDVSVPVVPQVEQSSPDTIDVSTLPL